MIDLGAWANEEYRIAGDKKPVSEADQYDEADEEAL